ncbi:MAG: NUDIX domain-containing protein [Clostridia bacterium]|nr:NUDIX domain-containing protein [Clostridia bacterium]
MSSYIMDLRRIVGHRVLMQVGASMIVEDAAGRTLLQRRTDNGKWGYAGGSAEPDEVVEEAAKRELFEETGLTALETELFGVFSGPETHYIYPNGDEVSNVDIVYLCKKFEGDLNPQPEEVRALAWFSADALPETEELSPPIRVPLLTWAEKKRAGKTPVPQIEILGDNRHETFDHTREGSRGIVIREGKILLSHERGTGWFLLPGGGIEAGETFAACCEREILEETGWIVKAEKEALALYEYYGDTRFGSRYFLCSVEGRGEMKPTEEEKKRGLEPLWLPVEEAVQIFSEHRCWASVSEEKRGSYLREYTALSEILRQTE